MRSCVLDVWLPLFVWAECFFVSELLSLTLVSRMFNYMLCHVSTAEHRLVMAALVCFPPSLTIRCCFLSCAILRFWIKLTNDATNTVENTASGSVTHFGSAGQVRAATSQVWSSVKAGPRVLPLAPAAPSLLSAPAQEAFTTLSPTAGTPFVSRFCTPNTRQTTHTHTPDLLPQFPKCPWDQGRFVVLVCLKTGHPSRVCVCVCSCACNSGGRGLLVVCHLSQHLFTHSWTVWDAKESASEWISLTVCCASHDSGSVDMDETYYSQSGHCAPDAFWQTLHKHTMPCFFSCHVADLFFPAFSQMTWLPCLLPSVDPASLHVSSFSLH